MEVGFFLESTCQNQLISGFDFYNSTTALHNPWHRCRREKKSAMRFCDNRFALVQFYNLNSHTTWMVQKTYKSRLCVQWAWAGVCPNACQSKRKSSLEEQSFNSRSQRISTDKFPSSMNWQSKIKSTGFPGGAVVENLPANAGDTGSSPGLGRSHMPRSN